MLLHYIILLQHIGLYHIIPRPQFLGIHMPFMTCVYSAALSSYVCVYIYIYIYIHTYLGYYYYYYNNNNITTTTTTTFDGNKTLIWLCWWWWWLLLSILFGSISPHLQTLGVLSMVGGSVPTPKLIVLIFPQPKNVGLLDLLMGGLLSIGGDYSAEVTQRLLGCMCDCHLLFSEVHE